MATSFNLVGTLQVMRNSPSANTATVWFDLWDSQLGANAKALINKALQFGTSACTMWGAGATPLTCAIKKHHTVLNALALTLRVTITLSLGVAKATPGWILLSNPQLQVLPVATLLSASTAVALMLPITKNADSGTIALIAVGFSR
jgi:hypothetical protein